MPELVPQPLPRGRHGLSDDEVRESQHARLTAAMLELVAERGYAATTVAHVAAAARVSPNRFYDFFDNKGTCFLAVCTESAEQLLSELMTLDAADWRAAVRAGMRRYLEWWGDRPELSRAYFIALPTVGEIAREQRADMYNRFCALFEALAARARYEEPALPPFSPIAARVLVGGITEVVGEEVREGRIPELTRLEDNFTALVIGMITQPSGS